MGMLFIGIVIGSWIGLFASALLFASKRGGEA